MEAGSGLGSRTSAVRRARDLLRLRAAESWWEALYLSLLAAGLARSALLSGS